MNHKKAFQIILILFMFSFAKKIRDKIFYYICCFNLLFAMDISELSYCGINFEVKKNGFSEINYILIHGDEDIVLTPQCSQTIFDWAEDPKKLVLINGAGHSFRETEEELTETVEKWIHDVF